MVYVQISKLQSAAPAAAVVATAVPAMPSASSLQDLQDVNPRADCFSNATANEAPAVLAAADSIADATGLAWATAVVTDQASLQKESLVRPPADKDDVSRYLCDAPVSVLSFQSDGQQDFG